MVRYEGEFRNDEFNGNGTTYYSDGSSWIGRYLNSDKEGNGIFVDSKGVRWKTIYSRNALVTKERINND